MIIMAHTDREQYAIDLQEKLRCPISWDDGSLGLVDAHIQAWEMAYDTGEEMAFVIQDDVILCEDFINKLNYHVSKCDSAMHLYLRNTQKRHVQKGVERAREQGKDHIILNNLYSGNSIGLPREHIKPMLKHFKGMKVNSGDKRINDYLRKNGIPVYFPLPNLVDHRSLPSLHSGNSSKSEHRKSIWFEHSDSHTR